MRFLLPFALALLPLPAAAAGSEPGIVVTGQQARAEIERILDADNLDTGSLSAYTHELIAFNTDAHRAGSWSSSSAISWTVLSERAVACTTRMATTGGVGSRGASRMRASTCSRRAGPSGWARGGGVTVVSSVTTAGNSRAGACPNPVSPGRPGQAAAAVRNQNRQKMRAKLGWG